MGRCSVAQAPHAACLFFLQACFPQRPRLQPTAHSHFPQLTVTGARGSDLRRLHPVQRSLPPRERCKRCLCRQPRELPPLLRPPPTCMPPVTPQHAEQRQSSAGHRICQRVQTACFALLYHRGAAAPLLRDVSTPSTICLPSFLCCRRSPYLQSPAAKCSSPLPSACTKPVPAANHTNPPSAPLQRVSLAAEYK